MFDLREAIPETTPEQSKLWNAKRGKGLELCAEGNLDNRRPFEAWMWLRRQSIHSYAGAPG
jgi:hypothetical protein